MSVKEAVHVEEENQGVETGVVGHSLDQGREVGEENLMNWPVLEATLGSGERASYTGVAPSQVPGGRPGHDKEKIRTQ